MQWWEHGKCRVLMRSDFRSTLQSPQCFLVYTQQCGIFIKNQIWEEQLIKFHLNFSDWYGISFLRPEPLPGEEHVAISSKQKHFLMKGRESLLRPRKLMILIMPRKPQKLQYSWDPPSRASVGSKQWLGRRILLCRASCKPNGALEMQFH